MQTTTYPSRLRRWAWYCEGAVYGVWFLAWVLCCTEVMRDGYVEE